MLKVLIVIDCPLAMLVLSSVRSPPPPVAVTVPPANDRWCQSSHKCGKCAAVPVASALLSCQVPLLALLPLDAAASQSLGSDVMVASTVPLSAVAQFAGALPLRILRIGLVPTAVSKRIQLGITNGGNTVGPYGRDLL